MTLHEGEAGQSYRVSGLELPTALERRLEALGILEGTAVTVLRKKPHGAMVIYVRGARFAIGRRIAENITVSGKEVH